MSDRVLDDISHRRYNVLRGTWVLVSPHRTKRPWQGQQEAPTKTTLPDYDESCYLCPGNRRAQGDINPDYDSTFVFVNDYSAVKENQVSYEPDFSDDVAQYLLKAEPVKGKCYVLTFSRFHNLTLADLPTRMIVPIVKCWTQIYAAHLASGSELSANAIYRAQEPEDSDSAVSHTGSQYRYMQIFENKGAAMGCSNPHPHGQVWTTSTLPEEPAAELSQLIKYRKDHNGSHMLVDYANIEINRKERIVFENAHFLACCPWWATWPYEVIILSKAHKRALVDFSNEEEYSLAECLADVTRRYDNLFETHFPYSMGIHQAPLIGTAEEINASHFHIHFYPPLLRSASVRKFLVGYELMAEPQRDITPEQAAARLRTCGGVLYRQRSERGG